MDIMVLKQCVRFSNNRLIWIDQNANLAPKFRRIEQNKRFVTLNFDVTFFVLFCFALFPKASEPSCNF